MRKKRRGKDSKRGKGKKRKREGRKGYRFNKNKTGDIPRALSGVNQFIGGGRKGKVSGEQEKGKRKGGKGGGEEYCV